MCVFVPDVYHLKRACGKDVLTHWPQSAVAPTQRKCGLTVNLLYVHFILQDLTPSDLSYTSVK